MSITLCAKIWQLTLEPMEKLVLLALGDYGNDDGTEIYPGYETLAEKTGLTERTIISRIQSLETKGLLRRITDKSGRGRKQEFHILFDGAKDETASPLPARQKGEADDRKGENDCKKDEELSPLQGQKGEAGAIKGEADDRKGENDCNPPHTPPIRKNLSDEPSIEPKEENHVELVFFYWREKLEHPQAKLTKERETKIKARLKAKYTVEQIKRAIDGCAASPFHRGQNDRGTAYDDIELICRDDTKLEKFIGLADKTPALARAAPVSEAARITTRNTANNDAAFAQAEREILEALGDKYATH